MSLHELAEYACNIEINMLKEPIGKQDQYAAVFGGFNAYTFHKDGSVNVEAVKIDDGSLMELQNNIFYFISIKKDLQVIFSNIRIKRQNKIIRML
jgi:D-glycero-alpha-D-manno-heptose-7-phosphate kinase